MVMDAVGVLIKTLFKREREREKEREREISLHVFVNIKVVQCRDVYLSFPVNTLTRSGSRTEQGHSCESTPQMMK